MIFRPEANIKTPDFMDDLCYKEERNRCTRMDMSRPIWKGYLSFGLVAIPVSLETKRQPAPDKVIDLVALLKQSVEKKVKKTKHLKKPQQRSS